MKNTYYRREESNWIGKADGTKVGANYWRAQARRVFGLYPEIEAVEIVRTGRKTDSLLLSRGQRHAPASYCVIVASTGGKWGRSRRDFFPKK